jgi:predicted nucleic acid-binding protein
MNVVADTNVVVSAIFWPGEPGNVWRFGQSGGFTSLSRFQFSRSIPRSHGVSREVFPM